MFLFSVTLLRVSRCRSSRGTTARERRELISLLKMWRCTLRRGGRHFLTVPPPQVLVGPVVQHLAECHAHAVVLVPDVRAYWFPVLRQASVRSVVVSPMGARGSFHWPSQDGSLREWRYPRWSMVAHELDFRSV